MNGHQSLLELRLQGYRPDSCHLFLLTEPFAPLWDFEEPENNLQYGWSPEIHINPDESIYALDLRCLHNLTVHIVGKDPQRVLTLFEHVLQFEPACAVAPTDEAFMYYTPNTGAIDLDAQQRNAA